MALDIFARCRDCERDHSWTTDGIFATEFGCGRWSCRACSLSLPGNHFVCPTCKRPRPTPRPSNGAGRCHGCGNHAAIYEHNRCKACQPVQPVTRVAGPASWGDALPAGELPPGVR